ncbi:YesL family protein [Paenibacillus chartarius]|uniref:YesL family protein n=1 Tax=Paenibacillus chartarius TaxID=747481 RepID=A0ABV6DMC1_9BACL
MEMKGLMGGFYRISEWIMRLSVTNVLWIICSIPVFFLLLAAMTSPEDVFMQTLVLIAIVSPFTLFPATAAMFAVARKWVMGEGDVPLLKTFFRGYKENYLQSMIGGILYVIIGVILIVNYRFYVSQAGTLQLLSVLFITFGVILMASLFNFFSILVHLHMKTLQIVKNALLITIGNPLASVALIVINGLILYISVTQFTFLIPFFMGSLVSAFSFFMFYKSFSRLQQKQQELEEKEQEKLAVQTDQTEEEADEVKK